MNPSVPPIQTDREIITRRTIHFPRRLVFQAWSDPQHLKNWWGPQGFTNTFEEFDFRVGGKWKFVMHGPDKGNYPNACEFIAMQEPHFIYWQRISKPLFRVAAIFEGTPDANTLLTFRMIFDSPEECARLQKFVVDKNEENFDRLEQELLIMHSSI
ncbi:SRPBCC domain-containing protein [Adhaeribacter swui]|uniref:SRPBCC domain-containing protein n=1 Tax=Adhaeribacter swui TaxID=2086471 RepID=A0A7G7GCJ7_9BACT|nr:SRPBCC family protein [Adhaeribacter swui]QNF34881.1 SRPBCC domain-containing protein [Adhaeribacter swui]